MAAFDFEAINICASEAKNGDSAAANRLMELAYPWVRWIIKQNGWFLPSGGNGEDMLQEGMIGVFAALEDWAPEIQQFTWFAKMCVERQLITVIQTQTRQKRKGQNEAMSLDRPALHDKHGGEDGEDRIERWDLPDTSGLGVDPAEVATGSEAGQLMEALREGMTNLERTVFERCLVGGQTYQQVATDLGRGEKSVDNALQRVHLKVLKRAPKLAADERFTPDTRALLTSTAALAAQPRHIVTDEELRATLPVELLRPPGLIRFGSEHLQWTVPADRLLTEYPDIRQYATDDTKRAVLAAYLSEKPWREIAQATGGTMNACKHHLRRMCEKAAKARGISRPMMRSETPLLQRIEQLWTKGHTVADIAKALAHVAGADEIERNMYRLYQHRSRRQLAAVPGEVQTRRIPLVRLNKIPTLLNKAKPLLIPEYTQTLKLYMQGYSHREIADRRQVALSCIGKNDLPVIRRALQEVPGFEWLYDATGRERQVRLLALEALGVTVEQALERVPVNHQELYRLYLDGLSHREIDRRLALRPGAAEKSLHLARSCIRRTDDFRKHPKRHNTPERDAARRLRSDPEMHRRYLAYGATLPEERRRLLDEWYKGTPMGAIIEMFGGEDGSAGRGRMWARVKRAGELLKEIEEAQAAIPVANRQMAAGD